MKKLWMSLDSQRPLPWEKNGDPAEQEGKGEALKSCELFFSWLKEADEEEDSLVMVVAVIFATN